MTNEQLENLKAVAKAAIELNVPSVDSEEEDDRAWLKWATPFVIIALIDEIQKYRARDDARISSGFIGTVTIPDGKYGAGGGSTILLENNCGPSGTNGVGGSVIMPDANGNLIWKGPGGRSIKEIPE